MSWNDERVALLSKLWLEGRSASQIASELGQGITRNAVIGKVHRLGLSGRAKIPAPSMAGSRQRPRPISKPPAGRPMAAPQPAAALAETTALPVPAERPAEVVIPFSDRVTIMELRETMCRWPLGDPASPDFRYCGCRAAVGPYCKDHARVAFQPTVERRRVERLARIA